MAKKRKTKPTYKKVGTERVQTNPKFTRDMETPWPDALIERLRTFQERLDDVVQFAFECGLKIGRARATKSGKRVKK